MSLQQSSTLCPSLDALALCTLMLHFDEHTSHSAKRGYASMRGTEVCLMSGKDIALQLHSSIAP